VDVLRRGVPWHGLKKDGKRAGVSETRSSGFTLIEVVMTMVILAILAAVAIPGFAAWLPNYRLKAAARDLVSNLQLAKMGAVKQNKTWAVIFDPGVTPGRYFICSDDNGDGWDGPPAMGGNDVVQKEAGLESYGNGTDFGHGNATHPVGATFGTNDISYTTPDEVAIFSSKGTVNNLGYVYLSNTRGACWAVGTPSTAGVIVLKKWTGSVWE
jgi:prepilin-type N-terminal cleavage/methylation domain-containing protein